MAPSLLNHDKSQRMALARLHFGNTALIEAEIRSDIVLELAAKKPPMNFDSLIKCGNAAPTAPFAHVHLRD